MSSLEDLDDQYREFWRQREEIKARHRKELEDELAPQRGRLQRAIFKVQADYGYTVGQVADTIGNTRNFVYLIRNDKPLIETDPVKRKERGVTTRLRPAPGQAVRKVAAIQDTSQQLEGEATVLGWDYDLDRNERTVWIHRPDPANGTEITTEYHYTLDQYNQVTGDLLDQWNTPDVTQQQINFYREIVQDINKFAIDAEPISGIDSPHGD